jgi:hypothetical protein
MSCYDYSRWIEFFKMDKGIIGGLCYHLRVAIKKQNTKYWLVVSMEVQVC